MRQRRQLDWHSERGKFNVDEVAPATGSLQTLAKTIFESLLIADLSDCRLQGRVADVGRPQCEDPRFFFAQIIALATRQSP